MLNRHENNGAVYAMHNTIALFFPLIFLGVNCVLVLHHEIYLNSNVFFCLTYCRGSSTCENSSRHTGPLQRGTPSRGRHHICFLLPSLA